MYVQGQIDRDLIVGDKKMTELKIIRVESFIFSNFTFKHFKNTNPIKIDTNEFKILRVSSERKLFKKEINIQNTGELRVFIPSSKPPNF